MGQEQSGLHALQQPDAEEWDPPMLRDADHKLLADKAQTVLKETKRDNQVSQATASQSLPGEPVTTAQPPGDAKENQTSCSISAADEGCGAWLAGSVDLKEVLRESHFAEIAAPASSPKIAAVPLQRPMSPRTEFNIHDAVVEGNITAIQKMVHGGVSLETPDKVCSLIFRIKHMLDCVELAFLEEGRTPLAMAAFLGRAAIARDLLSMGADKDARDLAGNTPLHHAATGSSDQGIMALRNVTMEHLVAAAAHLEAPNKQGRAPLHVAAASNNFRALRRLLNAGAHRAPIDQDGMRPVDLAGMLGFSDVVAFLTSIDHKAQADKIKQYQQWL